MGPLTHQGKCKATLCEQSDDFITFDGHVQLSNLSKNIFNKGILAKSSVTSA